jgi:hypothetical protein
MEINDVKKSLLDFGFREFCKPFNEQFEKRRLAQQNCITKVMHTRVSKRLQSKL